jgi:dienelactone hydrolase
MKKIMLFAALAIISLSGCVTTEGVLSPRNATQTSASESLVTFSKVELYPLGERVFGQMQVPVQIFFPKVGTAPYPLIIHQHGSSRDGFSFDDGIGKTDQHGTRLKQAALFKGFAFVALDAFESKGLSPSDKTKFPDAANYAKQLRNLLLAKYSNLDPKNTFYTGFSYGGDSVMNQLYPPQNGGWTALVAAEPSCNLVAHPSPMPYPLLILKGTQSHYYPIACQLVVERHLKVGNPVQLSLLEGGNHYFSLNGEIIYNGIAFNGCSKNPVFRDRRVFRRYDGTLIQQEDIQKECFTRESGKGQGRELLDDAIAQTIAFFEKNKTPTK